MIGLTLGVVSVLVTVYYGRRAYARRNYVTYLPDSPVPAPSAVHSQLVWRPSTFMRALKRCDEFLDQVNATGPVQPEVREQTLEWATNALLETAANVSPFSQGKANLFAFQIAGDGADRERRLVSRRVSGQFSYSQLLRGSRVVRLSDHAHRDASVAELSVTARSETVQSVRRSRFPSAPEVQLGATHILAIPSSVDPMSARNGELATVTVDLRYQLGLGFFATRLFMLSSWRLRRRALAIQSRLDALSGHSVQTDLRTLLVDGPPVPEPPSGNGAEHVGEAKDEAHS